MQDGRGGPWKKIGETKGTDFNVNDLKEHGKLFIPLVLVSIKVYSSTS